MGFSDAVSGVGVFASPYTVEVEAKTTVGMSFFLAASRTFIVPRTFCLKDVRGFSELFLTDGAAA